LGSGVMCRTSAVTGHLNPLALHLIRLLAAVASPTTGYNSWYTLTQVSSTGAAPQMVRDHRC